MNTNGERVLNIKKVLFYILSRYKFLVVCMFIGAILLGSTRFYLDSVNLQKEQSGMEERQNFHKQTEEILSNVFEDEEVQEIYLVIDYHKKYMDVWNYMNESLLMNLEANKVNVSSMQVLVDIPQSVTEIEYEQKELKNAVLKSYEAYVNSGALVQDIYNQIETDVSNEYIQELVSAEFSMAENNVCMFISIYESNELVDLADYVIEAIEQYATVVRSNVSNHSLDVVNQYTGIISDNNLFNRQQSMWNAVSNYQSKWNTAKNLLSDEQLKYYNYLIDGMKIETQNDNLSESAISINFKYVVLGAILGLLGACFIVLLHYMLSGYLISESDYNTMFGLKYFGMLFEDRDKALESATFVQQLEYGKDALQNYEDNISLLVLKIKLACKSVGVDTIGAVGTKLGHVSEDIINDLSVRLQKEGVKLVILDNVLTSGKAISDLFDIGHCVLIEKTEVSRVSDVQNLMELCRENKINVLGVVDIKK